MNVIFQKFKALLISSILNNNTFGRFCVLYDIKINLWLTAPKGATPVKKTSATDWQMAVRRINVIIITLR